MAILLQLVFYCLVESNIGVIKLCSPKKARMALRLDLDDRPSGPRINNLLRRRGEGRFAPAIAYTPSEYADGDLRTKWVSGDGEEEAWLQIY